MDSEERYRELTYLMPLEYLLVSIEPSIATYKDKVDDYNGFRDYIHSMVKTVYESVGWNQRINQNIPIRRMTPDELLMFIEYPDRVYETGLYSHKEKQ